MLWLIICILSYFLFSIAATVDKHLLVGGITNPKVYAFYVGTLGILVLILIPFVGFSIPNLFQVALGVTSGMIYTFASFCLYSAMRHFEVSRVIPAIGGLVPLFSLGLIYLLSGGKEVFLPEEFLIFILLVLGSVLINFDKGKFLNLKSLKLIVLAAFLFSFSFILAKYVYSAQPFWSGFIWMRIGGFIAAIFFLFSIEVRKELFQNRVTFRKNTAALFLSNQAIGAGAFVLLNWSISLAPLIYLTIINALAGIEYVFLFIFTVFLSLKFPKILKEEISRGIILQKITAILLIGTGLVLLAL